MGTESNDYGYVQLNIGPGITYFIMPANVYLTSSAGFLGLIYMPTDDDLEIERLEDEYRNNNYMTPADRDYPMPKGFYISAGIGKDWWLGKNIGLGPVVKFMFGKAVDKDYKVTIWTLTGGINLTYN